MSLRGSLEYTLSQGWGGGGVERLTGVQFCELEGLGTNGVDISPLLLERRTGYLP